ncbi:MAG: hypothetical protein ABWY78_06255 [Microvirga sp.]
MAFSVVVAGSSVQLLETDGTVTTVTLPAGISVITGAMGRFAIFLRNVIVVNAVSQPIWIDQNGVARKLASPAPPHAPTVAAGAAGGLTGDFAVAVSFIIKDEWGNLLLETAMSPISATVTVAAQAIAVSNIATPGDAAITGRRVYRTADGPTEELFEWFDIDDITTTTYSDDTSDEALSTEGAPDDLGTAPRNIEIITEWKGRLWAKSPLAIEDLIYSALNKLYAWPTENTIPVPPPGRDRFGITGLIKRRDEMGVCRRDLVWKIIGDDPDNFALVKVVEGKGCVSQDSIVVTRDIARFLGDDGVFEWDEHGFRSISDEKVAPWFTTDTYFNRAMFSQTFARYDPLLNSYDLFLAAAGSTSIDRWVSYDIERKNWLGPHKTDAFTPTSAGIVYDSNELLIPATGGDSDRIYLVTPGTYRDGAATAIAFDVTGKFHSGNAPDLHHYWGELSVLTKIESAGTLTITPKVGRLDASAQTDISHTLTTGRQRLRRLGVGPLMNLRFRNSEVNQAVELYGYELDWFQYGRR